MALLSQGAEAAAAAALRVAEADAVFEKADTDGSGAIDYEEFAVAASNTSFLRTGLQLLSVQDKLQREQAAAEAAERAAAEAAASAEGAARGRWCLCVTPPGSPRAEEGVPPPR